MKLETGIIVTGIIGIVLFLLSIPFWFSKSKKYLEERIMFLRIDFFSLTIGTFLGFSGFTLIVYTVFRYFGCFALDNTFFTTFLIGLLFGLFSIAAFYVARKIEKLIRQRIDSFAEFVDEAYEIFKEESKVYGLMVLYPYFGLLESVKDKSANSKYKEVETEKDLNELIEREKIKSKITIIVPDFKNRIKFLNIFDPTKAPDDVSKQYIRGSRCRIKELMNKELNILIMPFPSPLHIAVSERKVVWGSVKPSEPGKCKGFYSYDKDIIDAFWEHIINVKNIISELKNYSHSYDHSQNKIEVTENDKKYTATKKDEEYDIEEVSLR